MAKAQGSQPLGFFHSPRPAVITNQRTTWLICSIVDSTFLACSSPPADLMRARAASIVLMPELVMLPRAGRPRRATTFRRVLILAFDLIVETY